MSAADSVPAPSHADPAAPSGGAGGGDAAGDDASDSVSLPGLPASSAEGAGGTGSGSAPGAVAGTADEGPGDQPAGDGGGGPDGEGDGTAQGGGGADRQGDGAAGTGQPGAGVGPSGGGERTADSPGGATGSPAAPAPTTAPAPTAPGGGSGVDTSRSDRVIGTGTPASCTSDAVVDAVAAGGVITFDCGPAPVTITLAETAKVVNANGPEVVLDGGGRVTLSGGGQRRILYMNTCDPAQGWTTAHCDNQDHPRLTVENLTFADGNATGQHADGGGGGAIFVRGGQFRVVDSTFVRNRCDATGPDVGGAAIRVLSQYEGRPVRVSGSTFGGSPGQGGICSNGGALSSIGVSWIIEDSVFSHNQAIGNGANPARAGSPGGGSGGAIYLDGNRFTIELRRTRIEDNHANEGGGAVFFVSNDRSGTMSIVDSTLRRNPSDGFETQGFPGIFFLGARPPAVSGSTVE